MKCFYHEDNDGKCAGAIVKRKYPECECIPINYGHEFPFNKIKPEENIYIVDYSIEPDEMKYLLELASQVVWIDHHKTAIEKYGSWGQDIFGVRKDGISGCELTWRHLFPDELIPEIVILIGDRDIWKWEYGDRTKYTHLGLGLLDLKPESLNWVDLFKSDPIQMEQILSAGKTISLYKEQSNKNYFDSYAYQAEFAGYDCIAMNKGACGSEAFGNAIKEYDICISYGHFGNYFTVSLYSEKVDVSEIAKTFEYKGKRGGGHKGAAGFQCENLPFSKG